MYPHAVGDGDVSANPEIGRAEYQLRAAHPDFTPDEMEPIYYREARAFIREHPVEWGALLFRKTFYFLIPIGPSMFARSGLFRAASWIAYFGLVPFAIAGAFRLTRRTPQPAVLWLLALSALATCVIFYPQVRYRVPVFDPVLIVCAAALTRRPGLSPPAETQTLGTRH